MRTLTVACLGLAIAACAADPIQPDPTLARIVMKPDRAERPDAVRFEVPTALVMDLPGARVPNTLQARVATREIAAHELGRAGYCPGGFTGPDGVEFAPGDRSRAAFVVRCLPQ